MGGRETENRIKIREYASQIEKQPVQERTKRWGESPENEKKRENKKRKISNISRIVTKTTKKKVKIK